MPYNHNPVFTELKTKPKSVTYRQICLRAFLDISVVPQKALHTHDHPQFHSALACSPGKDPNWEDAQTIAFQTEPVIKTKTHLLKLL